MPGPVPQNLDELPANALRPLGVLTVEALRTLAMAANHCFLHADLRDCAGKRAVLLRLGEALALPVWYGANLDALYDCLTDLPDTRRAAGYVIVLEALPAPPRLSLHDREALLEVFADASATLAESGVAMRVFWSDAAD